LMLDTFALFGTEDVCRTMDEEKQQHGTLAELVAAVTARVQSDAAKRQPLADFLAVNGPYLFSAAVSIHDPDLDAMLRAGGDDTVALLQGLLDEGRTFATLDEMFAALTEARLAHELRTVVVPPTAAPEEPTAQPLSGDTDHLQLPGIASSSEPLTINAGHGNMDEAKLVAAVPSLLSPGDRVDSASTSMAAGSFLTTDRDIMAPPDPNTAPMQRRSSKTWMDPQVFEEVVKEIMTKTADSNGRNSLFQEYVAFDFEAKDLPKVGKLGRTTPYVVIERKRSHIWENTCVTEYKVRHVSQTHLFPALNSLDLLYCL
jgi:hypothetical protein